MRVFRGAGAGRVRSRWPVFLAAAGMAVLAGCASGPTAVSANFNAMESGAAGSSGPAGSATSPGTAATAAATAPAPGTTLASIDDTGATTVNSNTEGNGFTAVHDLLGQGYTEDSTLDTYDMAGNHLATLPVGSFTGDCTAADVQNPAGRLIITLLITQTPAQGITAATDSLTMTAWNATTGAKTWSTVLVTGAKGIVCPSSGDGDGGELWDFVATLDGKWGVFELPVQDASGNIEYDAINLMTGKTYPNESLVGVLGNYVVTGSGTDSEDDYPAKLTITTPGSWTALGSAAGSAGSQTANPQLEGGSISGSKFAPSEFAATGYTGDGGEEGNGTSAAVTPDGGYLAAMVSDGNGNSWYRGYALPSMNQLWSIPEPEGSTGIQGISNTALLITESTEGGDTYLVDLNPQTGQQVWKTDIADGSACDLTSTEVLVDANNQLATLNAATGKQLSYQNNPYQDAEGDETCPTVVENGLGGVGMNGNTVLQLLTR